LRAARFVLSSPAMTNRLPFLLVVLGLGCNGVVAPGDKPLPDDEPLVDGPADAVSGVVTNDLWVGGQAYGQLTATTKYLHYNLPLEAQQRVAIRLGGVATDGSILDTVLYIYGPKDAKGHRTRIAANDDRNQSDYGSALNVTASAAGQYLVVATSYTKPDPGQTALLIGCPDGPCFPPLGPNDPKPANHLDPAPFANPEVLAYFNLHFGENQDPEKSWPNAHVKGLASLLASDAKEDGSTGAVAASDGAYLSQTLQATTKGLSAAQRKTLEGALATYLGSPTDFTHKLSPHAQQTNLIAQAWDPLTAPAPAGVDGVVNQIVASWPGSKLVSTNVTSLGKNGQLYGFLIAIDLNQVDAAGNPTKVWEGLEAFNADGTYLGDFSLPAHDPFMN
jgi:hypothetical protein